MVRKTLRNDDLNFQDFFLSKFCTSCYDEFGSRDQLIVADRDQNLVDIQSTGRELSNKKIEVIRPRKRCVKLTQSRYGLGNLPMESTLDLN